MKKKQQISQQISAMDYFHNKKCDFCGQPADGETGVYFTAKAGERFARVCREYSAGSGHFCNGVNHAGNPVCLTLKDYIVFCKRNKKDRIHRIDCSRPYIKEMSTTKVKPK